MRMRALACLLLAAAACATKPPPAYVRIITPDGRLYFTQSERAFYSIGGGFIAFRDLVTDERVQLNRESFRALATQWVEIVKRREDYSKTGLPPRATDADLKGADD